MDFLLVIVMAVRAGVSASTYLGSASSAAVGGGSESAVHELRREVTVLYGAVHPLQLIT